MGEEERFLDILYSSYTDLKYAYSDFVEAYHRLYTILKLLGVSEKELEKIKEKARNKSKKT